MARPGELLVALTVALRAMHLSFEIMPSGDESHELVVFHDDDAPVYWEITIEPDSGCCATLFEKPFDKWEIMDKRNNLSLEDARQLMEQFSSEKSEKVG